MMRQVMGSAAVEGEGSEVTEYRTWLANDAKGFMERYRELRAEEALAVDAAELKKEAKRAQWRERCQARAHRKRSKELGISLEEYERLRSRGNNPQSREIALELLAGLDSEESKVERVAQGLEGDEIQSGLVSKLAAEASTEESLERLSEMMREEWERVRVACAAARACGEP